MNDDLCNGPNGPPEDNRSVEEILREHERLGRLIETRFKQETTILFTDICGYTHYMETMGDLKGRSMVQRHNDILFPIIQGRGGVVIKTIGDAVMARFADPAEAVHAAMDIQKALADHNAEADASDRIHVKIGVHTGKALVEETDVFGDAVNAGLMANWKDVINGTVQSEDVSRDLLGEALRYFDLVHFAGHSEYNSGDPGQSGWTLEDGRFTAADIMAMAGAATLPAFVFSNTCQSALTLGRLLADRLTAPLLEKAADVFQLRGKVASVMPETAVARMAEGAERVPVGVRVEIVEHPSDG